MSLYSGPQCEIYPEKIQNLCTIYFWLTQITKLWYVTPGNNVFYLFVFLGKSMANEWHGKVYVISMWRRGFWRWERWSLWTLNRTIINYCPQSTVKMANATTRQCGTASFSNNIFQWIWLFYSTPRNLNEGKSQVAEIYRV